MTTPDLQQFSIDELTRLIDEANRVLDTKLRERKARAMVQARAILEEAGVSPRELARTKVEKKPSTSIKQGVTYVNPDNPAESWTAGKGRRPKWLSTLTRIGGSAPEAKWASKGDGDEPF